MVGMAFVLFWNVRFWVIFIFVGAPIGLGLLIFSLLDKLLGYFLGSSLSSILVISQMTSAINHTAVIPSNMALSLLFDRLERMACGTSEDLVAGVHLGALNCDTVWFCKSLSTFGGNCTAHIEVRTCRQHVPAKDW
jgi:hypothetical protein